MRSTSKGISFKETIYWESIPQKLVRPERIVRKASVRKVKIIQLILIFLRVSCGFVYYYYSLFSLCELFIIVKFNSNDRAGTSQELILSRAFFLLHFSFRLIHVQFGEFKLEIYLGCDNVRKISSHRALVRFLIIWININSYRYFYHRWNSDPCSSNRAELCRCSRLLGYVWFYYIHKTVYIEDFLIFGLFYSCLLREIFDWSIEKKNLGLYSATPKEEFIPGLESAGVWCDSHMRRFFIINCHNFCIFVLFCFFRWLLFIIFSFRMW